MAANKQLPSGRPAESEISFRESLRVLSNAGRGERMSSFIVSHVTIHRIISFLFYDESVCKPYRWQLLKQAGFNFEKEEHLTKFGKALLNLNISAVDSRYREKNKRHTVRDYSFQDVTVSPIQALKSLHCFIYQCGEGGIPKRKLFRLVERIAQGVQNEIVMALPEYAKAEWG